MSRAYHVPAPADPVFWVYPVSACLFPGSALTTCPLLLDGQPATDLLVRACQPLWPNPDDEVYRQFTSVAHTELALHLTPHGGWQCRSLSRHRVNRQSRGALSPELHTLPLPGTHVQIGNCWSYNRSRRRDTPRSVTRQERAFPPTACRLTRG